MVAEGGGAPLKVGRMRFARLKGMLTEQFGQYDLCENIDD